MSTQARRKPRRHARVNAVAIPAMSGALAVTLTALAAATLIALLYMVKSALGINVLSGHVPFLHAALYPIVRG